MMRKFITAVTLVWTLAVSTTLCAGGWCTAPLASSRQCTRQAKCGIRKAAVHFSPSAECGESLSGPAAKCAFRGMGQAQLAMLRAPAISSPQRIATGNIPAIFDFGFVVSSIGSPQTDRGPPLS